MQDANAVLETKDEVTVKLKLRILKDAVNINSCWFSLFRTFMSHLPLTRRAEMMVEEIREQIDNYPDEQSFDQQLAYYRAVWACAFLWTGNTDETIELVSDYETKVCKRGLPFARAEMRELIKEHIKPNLENLR